MQLADAQGQAVSEEIRDGRRAEGAKLGFPMFPLVLAAIGLDL